MQITKREKQFCDMINYIDDFYYDDVRDLFLYNKRLHKGEYSTVFFIKPKYTCKKCPKHIAMKCSKVDAKTWKVRNDSI